MRVESVKPRPLKVPEFVILVDTREQDPFNFAETIGYEGHTRPATLKTGDYSVAGYESKICLERKSLGDAFSTIGQLLVERAQFAQAKHDGDPEARAARFDRECHRMRTYKHRAIILEESYTWIVTKPPLFSKLHPHYMLRELMMLCVQHNIWLLFGNGRDAAAAIAYRWLKYTARACAMDKPAALPGLPGLPALDSVQTKAQAKAAHAAAMQMALAVGELGPEMRTLHRYMDVLNQVVDSLPDKAA